MVASCLQHSFIDHMLWVTELPRVYIEKTTTTNRIQSKRGENGLHQVLMHCEPWTWSASFLVIPLWMKSYSEHPIRLRTFSKLMWTIFLKNENTTKQFQDNCVFFGVVGCRFCSRALSVLFTIYYLSLIRMHIFHQTQDYSLHISFDGKLIIIFCVEYEASVLQQEQHTHRHTLGIFWKKNNKSEFEKAIYKDK